MSNTIHSNLTVGAASAAQGANAAEGLRPSGPEDLAQLLAVADRASGAQTPSYEQFLLTAQRGLQANAQETGLESAKLAAQRAISEIIQNFV